LASLPKGSVTLPIYAYDHGSLSIQCGPFACRFDSGQLGYITIAPDRIRQEYSVQRITGKLREKVSAILESEVVHYNYWLQGACWGYEIEGHRVEDSCWGFIGDDLAYTGLKSYIPSEWHNLLGKAWDARFDGTWVMTPDIISRESSHG